MQSPDSLDMGNRAAREQGGDLRSSQKTPVARVLGTQGGGSVWLKLLTRLVSFLGWKLSLKQGHLARATFIVLRSFGSPGSLHRRHRVLSSLNRTTEISVTVPARFGFRFPFIPSLADCARKFL